MKEFPEWLSATLASDAVAGQGVLSSSIRALFSDVRAIGPAFVALTSQDDNQCIREVLNAAPPPGSVLVIAGGSTSRTATIGGLLALELQQAGIVALVTDGLVRDVQEIRQARFGVWCRGVTPIASRKNGPSRIGGTVSLAGTIIRDGDLIIADEDGVVIWPQEHFDELLVKARAKLEQDNDRLAKLQNR